MCGRFSYGFPDFPTRDSSLSHDADLSNTSAPDSQTWLAHPPLPGLLGAAPFPDYLTEHRSVPSSLRGTLLLLSPQALKYLYIIIQDLQPVFPLASSLLPGVSLPATAISTWPYLLSTGFLPQGPFLNEGPSPPAPPSGRKQDGAAGRGLWNLGSERRGRPRAAPISW